MDAGESQGQGHSHIHSSEPAGDMGNYQREGREERKEKEREGRRKRQNSDVSGAD